MVNKDTGRSVDNNLGQAANATCQDRNTRSQWFNDATAILRAWGVYDQIEEWPGTR